MTEIIFSIDVETNGPIPARYSMLSLGCAAFLDNGDFLDIFNANLKELPDAKEHPDTMKWWTTQQEAWKACRESPKDPSIVFPEFVSWTNNLCKKYNAKPVAIAYPAGFDWMWIYWYLIEFTGNSPFSFSALDIKTAAMVLLNCEYRKATKRNFPKKWFGATKHNHIAIDDAVEQGEMFFKMMKDNKNV
jgi:DNA polymerase III alpha subunit (gram-positive type)